MQQQKFWAFVKDTHVWTKRMFKLNLPKKLMNSPKFPDEILLPFVPTTSKPATPSQVLSPIEQSEEEEESKLAPQPPKTSKKAKASRKGKEKVHESPVLNSDSKHEEEYSEPEATLSPPPQKKAKTITPAKKKRSQLSAAEISHYYSSSDKEPAAQVLTIPKKKSKTSTQKVEIKQLSVAVDDDGSDLVITKEVHHRAAKTLCQMAQAAKR